MSNGFPCPNPTCTHVFAPHSIRGVSSVNCPRCGTVFQFRQPAPASSKVSPPFPPPSKPSRLPPPPPPSKAVPPPIPRSAVAPPVGPSGPGFDFAAPNAPIATHSVASNLAFDGPAPASPGAKKKKRRRGNGSMIVGAVVFLLLVGAAVGAFVYLPDYFSFGDDDQRKAFKTKGNFTITVPTKWRADDTLRAKFRANLAVSRIKPRGHFVLSYRDYQRRLPTDPELFDDALKRLRAYFPQFEYVNPFDQDNKGRNGELDGEPALVFTFSASDSTEVPLKGECHMLARHGYAYWLFFWGPEESQETLAEQFAGIRGRFKLYDERDGWKPRPRETEVVRGATVAFQANIAKDVWKNETNAKDADGSAEMLLRGFEPTEDEASGQSRIVPLAGKSAEILVLVLPAAPDLPSAVKTAKDYILKRATDANPDAKVEPVVDPASGKGAVGKDVGAFPGQVDRLKLALGPDNEKFAVLAVARRPEGILVVYGECKWDRRDYWEQEFKAFLETVRPSQKGR